MIYIQLDKNTDKSHLYKQIYNEIKRLILEFKIDKNSKLPSKRALATELNVSINTVANAYEQLLAEGYIYTIERKGYFVENITKYVNINSFNKEKLPIDLKEYPKINSNWLSLSHITTDNSIFPYHKWMKCQQNAIKYHKRELSEIPHPQGPYTVRKTISQMIALTRGVNCEPEQIVIGSGTQQLIWQLMYTQTAGTKIGVENPGYQRIYRLLKQMNFNVFTIGLDKNGIEIDEIKSTNPDFLLITPSHQFPTGIIMPISRRIELLNWATMSGEKYIIEDDYDSEYKYGSDTIPSLQSLDQSNCVIYAGTFSKTLLPSFRISYLVLPPKLLRLYRHYYSDWMQGSNLLHLFTLHYFIQSGEYAKHIKKMNHYYNEKRKYLIKELNDQFKESIKINDIPAGLHFIAEFNTNKGYEEIELETKKEKLEIYTFRRFNLQKEKKRDTIKLIIGFANIKIEDMHIAVNRLKRAIL